MISFALRVLQSVWRNSPRARRGHHVSSSGYISPPTVRSYRTSIENIRDNIRDGMPSFRISGM